MIDYDIGLPEGNDNYIPILTDHLARAIMKGLPVEHRASLVRAINSASEQIAESDQDWVKLQILRGAGDGDLSLGLSLSFMEIEEGDLERRMILQGRVSCENMYAQSEFVRIENVPESIAGQISKDRPIREVVDTTYFEGLVISHHTIAGNGPNNSIEIILQESPREEIENILHEWRKRP